MLNLHGRAADRRQAGEPALQLGTLDQRGAAVLAGGQLFLADGFLDAGMTAPRYLGRLRGRIREGVNRFESCRSLWRAP